MDKVCIAYFTGRDGRGRVKSLGLDSWKHFSSLWALGVVVPGPWGVGGRRKNVLGCRSLMKEERWVVWIG